MNDYEKWVRYGQNVEARYAHGNGVRARGTVFSYTDRPTVGIRTADGKRVDWIADLCVPVGEPVEGTVQVGGRVAHLEKEVEYWRTRFESLAKQVAEVARDAKSNDLPPEPPIGTQYLDAASGKLAWERTADGWRCSKDPCLNCPCDWVEAWDLALQGTGFIREFP